MGKLVGKYTVRPIRMLVVGFTTPTYTPQRLTVRVPETQ